MKLKSERMSALLKIMLGALVVLSLLDLAGSFAYAASESFYADYVMSINDKISFLLAVLYLIILVIYLIWIYRVHADLNRLIPGYPRSPVKSLACMLIPIYNFYGVPSTFYIMGSHFQKNDIQKQGRSISALSIPVIILFFMKYASNRLININIDEPSASLYIFDGLISATMYFIFYRLTVSIARALFQLNGRTSVEASPNEENVLSR
ncbi:hypothetical protein [Paenibacillus montanisoli]|uniref:DUF4328 domain-containing protein n=1 Tax=Paenibacillus montanisoli TaxID=2081970 RepID=A0A328TYT6_9BACL|nr:hypothetical protein [Paenibacillus montanisoli]RAP74912.1 hypothetical protein DL346_16025 [Paenibacillus montanisoli]